ncbi:MAG: Asp-tRNA(Asn)/Glu-tRNA(Gln) amidotransferase subunit GatB [Candidatus Margulisiibacteriota bacterium]|jgi:aspartyl-tRNA(Asn)/glutamyl-tRNA(Gln) amidotransferase subunit B
MSKYEVVIGLEVHAQLKTKSKAFCACSTNFGNEPNKNTCPVCLALPGALPVLNKKVVDFAIMAGLALNCNIEKQSIFARKNYFYPDLPKGYQISQFDKPICTEGELEVTTSKGTRKIKLERIHIEEDAGKLIHLGTGTIANSHASLVDLNRASTPLIEIVSKPDIQSAEEAKAYMEDLTLILKYLGICDGNLEEGSLRADANISLRLKGETTLGTKTEVKNLNSFKSVERAIELEIKRQEEILLAGGKIHQETRHFDEKKDTTIGLRSKEEAHDYRYFPEPDLLPLIVTQDQINQLKTDLPELPKNKKSRYQNEHNLSVFEITVLLNDFSMNTYFEQCLKINQEIPGKEICKWIIGDLNFLVKENKTNFEALSITPEKLLELISLINKGSISGKIAKELLSEMFKSGKNASELLAASGVKQITDESALIAVVDTVLKANADVALKIKEGKLNSVNFLMGLVMKETKGQAKPDLVKELIIKRSQI